MFTDDPRRDRVVAGTGVISRLPPSRRTVLRCKQDAIGKVSAAIGLDLPSAACTASQRPGLAALWLGPDEWLLLAPDYKNRTRSPLGNLGGIACSIVDVSDRQVALGITGPLSELMLASGCPLDLDMSSFPVNMCTRTLFQKAQIILWRTAPQDFHLEIWRSFAPYVETLLAQADCEA